MGAEAADPFGVVAAADEEHALLDAQGGFFAVGTGHAAEGAGVLSGLDDFGVGGFGVGAGDFGLQLHGAAHVGGADPAAVNGGFGEDGFAVGDGLGGFDLDHHEDLVVGPVHVVSPVALGVGGAERTNAAGRIADGFAGAAGVFSRMNHGDDDAEHAGIEGLADFGDVVARDAGEGDGAAGDDGDEAVLEQGPVPDPVLLFEHDPVVAEAGADFGGDGGLKAAADADGGFAAGHFGLGLVGVHGVLRGRKRLLLGRPVTYPFPAGVGIEGQAVRGRPSP